MHHTKPAAIENGSERIRLGAGGANHASISYHLELRAAAAQSYALGLTLDCGGLCMVHIEMVAAVESLSSTEMLEPNPGTLISWPGGAPGDRSQDAKSHLRNL